MAELTRTGSTRIRDALARHPERATVVAILALTLLFAALGVHSLWGTYSVGPLDLLSPWLAFATVVPGCLLVLAKRRAPGAALLVGTALFAVDTLLVGSLGMLLILLDLLFTASGTASPRRRRALLAVILAVCVGATVSALILTRDPRTAAFIGVQTFGILGTSYWWATAVAQAQELAALHEERARDAERVAALGRAEAVREERERMARDLHDAVAGHLSAVAIRTEAALSGPVDATADRAALQAARDSSLRSHEALRSLIDVLRTGEGAVAAAPRITTAAVMIAEATSAGLTVTASPLPAAGSVPDAVDQSAGRILQEALVNAARHAPGSRVEIETASGSRELSLTITSRGGAGGAGGAGGVSAVSGNGMGIPLMTERAAALGGTLDARALPADGTGWRVAARLPTGARP